MTELLFLLIGILAGAALGWLYARHRLGQPYELIKNEKLFVENQLAETRDARIRLEEKLDEAQKEKSELRANLAVFRNKLETQKQEVDKLQEKFTRDFENIAHKILKQNTRDLSSQNKERLGEILNPLKDKLGDFEKKVTETYGKEAKERYHLQQEVKRLQLMYEQMSTDARNLTRALKGDTKTQGDWGEMILTRILERSGLEEGREYTIQKSFTTDTGKRQQPDVIIRLPEQKNLVIDSKVSLTAYERFYNAEDKDGADKALKAHLRSIRQHMEVLHDKKYQEVVQGLDFVLMFIPVEPAFGLAVQHDQRLFSDAFEKNVVIVSPTTLLATLRTIASIWRQEKQNRHARQIADEAGKMYDKFKLFVDDLRKIGERIQQSEDAYQKAVNKLSTGRGNLIRKAEQIKNLGAKASKKLMIKSGENALPETEEDAGGAKSE